MTILDYFSSEIDTNRLSVMFFGCENILEKILQVFVELSLDLQENFISMLSRLCPRVSGNIIKAKMAPNRLDVLNIHIVISRPTMAFKSGYIFIVANISICAMLVVRPPNLPLNLNGYNSEVMTHGNVTKPIMDAPT